MVFELTSLLGLSYLSIASSQNTSQRLGSIKSIKSLGVLLRISPEIIDASLYMSENHLHFHKFVNDGNIHPFLSLSNTKILKATRFDPLGNGRLSSAQ
jgi:hypothetical protein